jgi:hypothetical protein
MAMIVALAGAARSPALGNENAIIAPVSSSMSGLAVSQAAGQVQIRFSVDVAASPGSPSDAYIGAGLERSLGYFFLGLCIPSEKLWVNLKPQQAQDSIDPLVENTDLGKIMLAADLTLKKDASEVTNPRTSAIGREYWNRLYAKAQALGIDEMPIANRVWIIPGKAVLSETADSVGIVNSPLQVCLESDYLSEAKQFPNKKMQELSTYGTSLMREMVLPALNKKVNEGAAYENLRQAYRAVILARWFKQHYGTRQPQLLQTISAAIPKDLSSRLPYSSRQIYREYMQSLQQGEYNFSEDSTGKLQSYLELITRRYFSGGIDLRLISVEHADGGKLTRASGRRQIGFDLIIDGSKEHPVRHAMSHIRFVAPGAPSSVVSGSTVGNDLPPVSPLDINKRDFQRRDPAIERIMMNSL